MVTGCRELTATSTVSAGAPRKPAGRVVGTGHWRPSAAASPPEPTMISDGPAADPSRAFGPMQQLANIFGANAPVLLGPDLVFFGLMNIVTWQWAGYYMIIIYAALQGIDSSIYEAARMDGANSWQIAFRIKVPMVSSALLLILVFALIGTLQFFSEPQILRPLSNGTITPDFTPNIYAFSQAFAYANFNYASAISFALGIVVFIAVYVFLFFTRKRGSVFT